MAHRSQSLDELSLFGLDGGIGCRIMLVMLDGFELAKLRGKLLVFLCLAGLPAQICELCADLANHVFEAFEIGFRCFEAQFGFVAAAIEPRDAGRVLEDTAALLRLRVYELADLPLLHQRLTARPRSCVGEQDLDVLGARFLAVHLIDGAGLALNAPGNLKHVGIVEGGGRGAFRIVDRDHHLRHVARGALVGAREDYVVHRGAAHALIGRFAHYPAKRL